MTSLLRLMIVCLIPLTVVALTMPSSPAAASVATVFGVPSTGDLRGSLYGDGHNGLDISADYNYGNTYPIVAAGPGMVVFAGFYDQVWQMGHMVVIRHGNVDGNSVWTFYAHMGSGDNAWAYLAVKAGDVVYPGRLLGWQGASGLSDGNHLHFEVRVGAADQDWTGYRESYTAIDPSDYIGYCVNTGCQSPPTRLTISPPPSFNSWGWTAGASINGSTPQEIENKYQWWSTTDSIIQAMDRDPNSRWTTSRVQTPWNDFFILDLVSDSQMSPQTKSVYGVYLDVGTSTGDYPRGVAIEWASQYEVWQSIASSTTIYGDGDALITWTPVNARWIRIWQTGSAPNNYWSIHEVRVLSGTPSVSASHNNVQRGPDNLRLAVDGDLSSRWSTRVHQLSTGPGDIYGMWFKYDLGSAMDRNYIVLDNTGSPNDYPRTFEVQRSNDDVNWSWLAGPISPAPASSIPILFARQSMQLIRILQTGTDANYWWSIHDIYAGLDELGPSPSIAPPPYSPPVSLQVSWSASDPSPSSGIQSYDVQYQDPVTGNWTPWLNGVTQTSAQFAGAAEGKTYNFQSRARDRVGNQSGWSGVGTTVVDSIPPWTTTSAPRYTSSPNFSVSWTSYDATSGSRSYDVQEDTGSGWTNKYQGATFTSFSVNNPACGITYKYQVRGRDWANNVEAWHDPVSVNFDNVAPGVPTISNNPINNKTWAIINLSAADACGLPGTYDIECKTTPSGTWTTWGQATASSAGTGVMLFRGSPGATYYFRAKATDLAGNQGAMAADTLLTVTLGSDPSGLNFDYISLVMNQYSGG